MKRIPGTPKTLNEAIRNGLLAAVGHNADEAVKIIEMHVTDFMNQHFTVAYFRADEEHWSKQDILNVLASRFGVKIPEAA